ncbi:box C/D snoRNA protein 1 [Dendroctonus ponderosae]
MEPETATPAPIPHTRLGECEVCAGVQAKYSCPKCEVKTCSLQCSRIHKAELVCDGLRDKTKYLPMNQFTDLVCESDYRLLQSITDRLDAIKKESRSRRLHSYLLPRHLLKLRSAAQQRRTLLKFLPMHFVRHRRNTSRWDIKRQHILWHLEWVFVNADNLVVREPRVDEEQKIGSLLSRHLVKQEDPALQERMQFYQAADLSGLKVLLRAEQKGTAKFYEMDLDLTVRECLAKRLIIEHPVIHVVLRDHGSGFQLIDTDDEDQVDESRTGGQVIEKLIKRAENDERLCNSLTNLLFVTDQSDEEPELT